MPEHERSGHRLTINLEVKDNLNFKVANFTANKSIFKYYRALQFYSNPANNVHSVVVRILFI